MRILLLSMLFFLPGILLAQTAPAIGTTTFNNNFSGTGNILGTTASPGTVSNVGNTSEITGILASGWDFTIASTGNVSMSAAAAGANPTGSTDYCIRLNAQAGSAVSYASFKSNNAQPFSLQSVYLKANITVGAPASFTLTGYKGGSLVTGATLTVNNIATGTWTVFDVSAKSAFSNVDELRFAQSTGGTATVTFLAIDQITIAAASSLPLTLGNFSGRRNGEEVLLNWITLMESNTRDFEVQRSVDGAEFQTIGQVAAAGNSTTKLDYSYADAATDPAADHLYYRLLMTDLDGASTYSPVLRIASIAGASFSTYPNPFSSQLNALIHANAATTGTLNLSDVSGRRLFVRQLSLQPGDNSIPLSEAGTLPKGVYFLTLRMEGNNVQTIPLLKTGR